MPPKGAKKKNGYQLPEKFDDGFVLKDIFKINWTLGKPIGQGGFGLIYLANKGESKVKNVDDAQYVVKIEPKDNGPLFCETHFYINCAKEEEIKTFMRAYNLKHLAMPKYISSGLCIYKDKEYRFLVMDRYVKDLQTVLNQMPNNKINEIGVMCIMRQILNCLQYIHERGYAHGDIKGANLMLKNDQEAYLVDFGLACRFKRDNIHQKYEIKPERKHNGTIEYTSRDAHSGAQINRRSDLEILGYCIIHWLSGSLPWIDLIKNPEQVQQSKIKNMKNYKDFVKNSLINCSDSIKIFMEYYLGEINKLEHDSEPSYQKIQTKLTETLKMLGHSSTDNFQIFKQSTTVQKKTAAATMASYIDDEKNEPEIKIVTKQPVRRKRIEYTSENDEEDTKPLTVAKAKPKLKETPSKSDNATNGKKTANKNDSNMINEISLDEEFDKQNDKNKSNKKARNYLQSTAIDQTENEHFPKEKFKFIIEEDVVERKSPRIPKKSANDSKHPQTASTLIASNLFQSSNDNITKESNNFNSPRTRNVTSYKEIDTDDGSNDLQRPQQCLSKDLLNTPNKYEFRTTPNRQTPASKLMTGAINPQIDSLKKIKQNIISDPPRSPLALSNLDKNNGFTLVKKRKNVPKSTVATQTDESYLSIHYMNYR